MKRGTDFYHKAKRSEPIITNTPTLAPVIVGQSVPELGRAGVVGVGVEILGRVGAAVGAAATGQLQVVWSEHDGFLQKPW
jgi:hypothetical protein